MLYDPNWQKTETAIPNPFALETLRDWLKNQPREKEYDYYNFDNCLLCQYFMDQGFSGVIVNVTHAQFKKRPAHSPGRRCIELPGGFDAVAGNARYPYTMGGALRRAQSALRRRRKG